MKKGCGSSKERPGGNSLQENSRPPNLPPARQLIRLVDARAGIRERPYARKRESWGIEKNQKCEKPHYKLSTKKRGREVTYARFTRGGEKGGAIDNTTVSKNNCWKPLLVKNNNGRGGFGRVHTSPKDAGEKKTHNSPKRKRVVPIA